jgi:hypothetical protein
LARFTDLTVGDRSTDDWYCLVHKTKGSFARMFDSGFMLVDDIREIDPLFHRHNYVLDMDKDVFHYYDRQNLGRSWPVASLSAREMLDLDKDE